MLELCDHGLRQLLVGPGHWILGILVHDRITVVAAFDHPRIDGDFAQEGDVLPVPFSQQRLYCLQIFFILF